MSEKIFHWLLKLYPRRFRDEYGNAMRQLIHDRIRAETGILARMRLWTDLLTDLVISVPREYRQRPPLDIDFVGYRLSETAVIEMANRSHVRGIPSILVAIALGAMIGWMGQAPFWPLCAVYGLLVFLIMASLVGLSRWKDYWRSYELIVDEDRVQQIEAGGVRLTLHKAEITRLLETRDVGIAIQTRDPRKAMWVPSVLNGYEELRTRLAAWAPLEESPQRDPHLSVHGHRSALWVTALYPASLPNGKNRMICAAVWLIPLVLIALLAVKLALVLR